MQIENCNVAVSDPYEVYKVWSDFKVVPMAANVQIIFFRNEKSNDILVKIMHNENEVHIPVQTDMFPYYRWRDVENYYRECWNKNVFEVNNIETIVRSATMGYRRTSLYYISASFVRY